MTDPNRRIALSALACTGLSACASLPVIDFRVAPNLIKPPPLREGDTIGLVSPSGVLDESTIARRASFVERLGFKVKLGRNLNARWGGYSGTVEQRLEDLHSMFADSNVRALWAARGGSGASGLLPHLDYALIARNPKLVIGFSDTTALLSALYAKIGLVGIHGPTAGSSASPFTLPFLRAMLLGESVPAMLHSTANLAKAADETSFEPVTYQPGIASGQLMGGNLSVLGALVGTPYMASLQNHLLFLEEIDEAPYRVDRLLHQLQQHNAAGHKAFNTTRAVILGVLRKCEARPGDNSLSLREVITQHLKGLTVPAVSGYSFGHIADQIPLPFGIQAELDTQKGSLRLLERVTDWS